MQYPKSEIYVFKPLNERVPVYQKPFTLVQDVILEGTPQAQAALRGKEAVTLNGTLEYQACDDKLCFNPTAIPLSWTLTLRQLVTERPRATTVGPFGERTTVRVLIPWRMPDAVSISQAAFREQLGSPLRRAVVDEPRRLFQIRRALQRARPDGSISARGVETGEWRGVWDDFRNWLTSPVSRWRIGRAVVGTVGVGEERPVATNGTVAGRQMNRRVEIIVSGESIGCTR